MLYFKCKMQSDFFKLVFFNTFKNNINLKKSHQPRRGNPFLKWGIAGLPRAKYKNIKNVSLMSSSASLENMRDLIFRNLTSEDKRKKILQAQEVISDNGVLTKIQRGFICFVRPVSEVKHLLEHPEIYITKYSDENEHVERLLLKVKGGLYAVNKGELYFISFCHSLRVNINKSLPV